MNQIMIVSGYPPALASSPPPAASLAAGWAIALLSARIEIQNPKLDVKHVFFTSQNWDV